MESWLKAGLSLRLSLKLNCLFHSRLNSRKSLVSQWITQMSEALVKRLEFDSSTFYRSPQDAILSKLGADAKLFRYTVLPIILPNGRVVVDVEYDKLEGLSMKTFTLSADQLKATGRVNEYTFDVDGRTACVSLRSVPKGAKLRVRLEPFKDKTGGFIYSGVRVLSPLHSYSTVVRKQVGSVGSSAIGEVHEVKPGQAVHEVLTEEESIEHYKFEVKEHEALSRIINLVVEYEFSKMKRVADVGYLTRVDCLPKEGCSGVVHVISQRISWMILYYPFGSGVITGEELEGIKRWMEVDQSNLIY